MSDVNANEISDVNANEMSDRNATEMSDVNRTDSLTKKTAKYRLKSVV